MIHWLTAWNCLMRLHHRSSVFDKCTYPKGRCLEGVAHGDAHAADGLSTTSPSRNFNILNSLAGHTKQVLSLAHAVQNFETKVQHEPEK